MTTGPVCRADPAASYQAPTTLQHRRFLSPSTQTDPCRELDASQLLIRCVPTNLSSTVLHLGRAHSWTRIPPWGRDDRVAHQQDISAVCAGECVQRTLDAATMFPGVAHAATGRETAFSSHFCGRKGLCNKTALSPLLWYAVFCFWNFFSQDRWS